MVASILMNQISRFSGGIGTTSLYTTLNVQFRSQFGRSTGRRSLTVFERVGGSRRIGSTGGIVWNSSRALASMIANGRPRLEEEEEEEGERGSADWIFDRTVAEAERSRNFWQGTRVIELGAGCGLAGLTAAFVRKSNQVILTDLPAMIPVLQKNIRANRKDEVEADEVACEARVLDWTRPPSWFYKKQSTSSKHMRTIILACDVVFGNTEGWSALIDKVLARYFATVDPRALVLLAFEERDDRFPSPGFFERLRELFRVDRVRNLQKSTCSNGRVDSGGGPDESTAAFGGTFEGASEKASEKASRISVYCVRPR